MAWALPRAANQFWMLSEPERATAFLQATRNRVSSPTAQTTLDALSATFAMNAGSPGRAMQIAEEVLASPSADDTAVGWAGAAAALSSARMGRFAEVDALADRAIAAGHPGLLRFTSGFGQTTALLMAGELDRAQALGQQLTDFAQLQQPGRAIGEVLVADVLIAKGDLEAAVRLLRRAAAALAPTGYSWGPLAWMLLAQALGQLGATVEAGKALSRAESRHGLKSMLFAPELALARAWTMSARRDEHGAVAAARDAARSAERGGQSAVALRALLDAVRLGDIRAVDGIARASGRMSIALWVSWRWRTPALWSAVTRRPARRVGASGRDRHEPRGGRTRRRRRALRVELAQEARVVAALNLTHERRTGCTCRPTACCRTREIHDQVAAGLSQLMGAAAPEAAGVQTTTGRSPPR